MYFARLVSYREDSQLFFQIGRNIFHSLGWLAASDMEAEMSVMTLS